MKITINVSDNPTNGDMIKAILFNSSFDKYATNNTFNPVSFFMDGIIEFDMDWWNAPYKAESEDLNE